MKRSKALVDLVMQMVARLDQPSSVNQTATPASAATTVKDEFGMEQETQPSSASAAASSSGDSSSTDLYSTLNIGALTFTFTNGMHSLTCNHALPKLLGYPSPAAFLELTDSVEGISYLYPESNLPRIIPAYVDAILDGRYDFAAQTEWRARDGIRRRALQSVTIMYDAEGLPWKSTALVCALADAQMLPVDARVALMPSAMPSLSTGGMTSPREGNCVYGYNASAQQQQLLSPPPPQVSFTSSYTATPSSSTLTTTSSSMSVYQPNYYVSASPPSLPPPSSVSASYTPLSMYLPPPQSQMPFGYQQPSNPMFQTHAPSHPQARPPSQKSTSPPSTIGESQKFYTKLRR
jgi:hypothetical protein